MTQESNTGHKKTMPNGLYQDKVMSDEYYSPETRYLPDSFDYHKPKFFQQFPKLSELTVPLDVSIQDPTDGLSFKDTMSMQEGMATSSSKLYPRYIPRKDLFKTDIYNKKQKTLKSGVRQSPTALLTQRSTEAEMHRDNPTKVDIHRDNPTKADIHRDNSTKADIHRDNSTKADIATVKNATKANTKNTKITTQDANINTTKININANTKATNNDTNIRDNTIKDVGANTDANTNANKLSHDRQYIFKHKSARGFYKIIYLQDLSYFQLEDQVAPLITTKRTLKLMNMFKSTSKNPELVKKDIPVRLKCGIVSLKFSKTGKYLAVGLQNGEIYVWKSDIQPREIDGQRYLCIFREQPVRYYKEHVSDILGISWNGDHSFLSCSSDRKVKLWKVDDKKSVMTFMHQDFVVDIDFHPIDPRFFVTASLDNGIRIWSVEDGRCILKKYVNLSIITTICFTKDGTQIIVGTYCGKCVFFDTTGLKYKIQLPLVINGKNQKITSIDCQSENEALISSNDSCIRLVSLRSKSIKSIYKGHLNCYSQIGASYSPNREYIISGSETKQFFIWHKKKWNDQVQGHNKKFKEKLLGIIGLIKKVFCMNSTRLQDDEVVAVNAQGKPITCAILAPGELLKRARDFLDAAHYRDPLVMGGGDDSVDAIIITGDAGGSLKVWINSTRLPDIYIKKQ